MREIIIAAGGKSEYKIAVPQNASQPEMFAARELQKYIAEASGASLPIAEEGGAGSLFISVGNTRAFAALGIALDEKTLNYDGFVIKTAGRCVYIAAACGRGVVYGACDFAERFLGVKFLSPGETLVPECDKVVVGETDILEKPVFRFRNFYDGGLFFTNQNPAYADTLYGVHRRMYSDYSPVRPEWGYGAEWYKEIRTDHNIFSYVSKEKYGKEHILFTLGYASGEPNYSNELPSGLDADSLVEEAVKVAREADVVLFFGGLNKNFHQDCEGDDRLSMDLPFGQNELIEKLIEANPNTGIIIISGNAVSMPWLSKVDGLIQSWYLGSQGGPATANVISGEVCPSGKLPFSIPVKLEDNSAHYFGEESYPGVNDTQYYKDDILVGYRWYDTKKIKSLFPFGYGLSYTTFNYGKARTDKKSYRPDEKVKLSFTLKNSGQQAGAETVQVYMSQKKPSVLRPVKELKAFEKVFLQPGEERVVELEIPVSSFAFYDEGIADWKLENDKYLLHVASSSRQIHSTTTIEVKD